MRESSGTPRAAFRVDAGRKYVKHTTAQEAEILNI